MNARRGEVIAVLDGREHVLCLTLGALAELEGAFEENDLTGLAGRLSSGRLSAADLLRVIGAGLRGAGHDVDQDAVAAMRVDGGAVGYARIAVDLLNAAFGE